MCGPTAARSEWTGQKGALRRADRRGRARKILTGNAAAMLARFAKVTQREKPRVALMNQIVIGELGDGRADPVFEMRNVCPY